MQSTSAIVSLGIFLSFSPAFMKADPLNTLAPLGTASSFAVLGASTVTNTGPSVLGGDLGLAPGTSIVGFPPGVVNGTIHDDDGVAALARADALTAYNYFAGLAPTSNLTGENLGGQTLTSGVYFFASSAQLTGPLTLNFQGLSDVDIIFQIGSTLTTASDSVVDIINAGTDDNVFWQVGSSATLGTTSAFQGTILAEQSITLTTGATINCGSALALTGAVTLDTNTINPCSTSNTTTGTGDTSPVPEPGTLGLLGTGIVGMAGVIRRRLMV